MTGILFTAFLLGSIGSVHCIGMCGPLALSLPAITDNNASKFLTALLYNAGRVVTYGILGAVFGIIGMSFALFGYQQWLSIILGMSLLIFTVFPGKKYAKSFPGNSFFAKVRKMLSSLFIFRNYRSVFIIGLLNGLLPCGLIYMAIAGAISTASVLKSSLFMTAFGLGTLPVMWSIAFFGSFVSITGRRVIKKFYPYIIFTMAVLLIIRGMGLQIPYISPSVQNHPSMKQRMLECHD